MKHFVSLCLVALFITAFASASLAQDAGSARGPVFLNKIKNFFGGSEQASPSQREIAPLANRGEVRASNNYRSRSRQQPTLGEQRYAQWMANRQKIGQAVAQQKAQIRADLQANYQNAQAYQAYLKSGQAQAYNRLGATAGSANPPAGGTAAPNMRIIIPQEEETGGAKPIFKNYR